MASNTHELAVRNARGNPRSEERGERERGTTSEEQTQRNAEERGRITDKLGKNPRTQHKEKRKTNDSARAEQEAQQRRDRKLKRAVAVESKDREETGPPREA